MGELSNRAAGKAPSTTRARMQKAIFFFKRLLLASSVPWYCRLWFAATTLEELVLLAKLKKLMLPFGTTEMAAAAMPAASKYGRARSKTFSTCAGFFRPIDSRPSRTETLKASIRETGSIDLVRLVNDLVHKPVRELAARESIEVESCAGSEDHPAAIGT